MIYFYTGVPRSGKSLDMAKDCMRWLSMGRTVIGTMHINKDMAKVYPGTYIYVDIYEVTPQLLIEYALRFNKKGKEGSVKVVLDECHRIFNTRFMNDKNRREWLEFFPIHGQLGYDMYLITQRDRQIDRQIRDLFEYEVVHIKGNNAGNLGWILSLFIGTFFLRIEKWYGSNEVMSKTVFLYKKRYGQFYDSYMAFEEKTKRKNELLDYLKPKPLPETGGGSGGLGSPATDDSVTVTSDGYLVDRYGFLTPTQDAFSSLLDNSNTLHSQNATEMEDENVNL